MITPRERFEKARAAAAAIKAKDPEQFERMKIKSTVDIARAKRQQREAKAAIKQREVEKREEAIKEAVKKGAEVPFLPKRVVQFKQAGISNPDIRNVMIEGSLLKRTGIVSFKDIQITSVPGRRDKAQIKPTALNRIKSHYEESERIIAGRLPSVKQFEQFLKRKEAEAQRIIETTRIPEIERQRFTPEQIAAERRKREQILEFEVGVYKSFRDKPLKGVVTAASFVAVPPVLKGIGALAKAAGAGKKAKAAAKAIELGVVGLYATQKGSLIMSSKDARELGYNVGDTFLGEIGPAVIGGAIGVKVVSKIPAGAFKLRTGRPKPRPIPKPKELVAAELKLKTEIKDINRILKVPEIKKLPKKTVQSYKSQISKLESKLKIAKTKSEINKIKADIKKLKLELEAKTGIKIIKGKIKRVKKEIVVKKKVTRASLEREIKLLRIKRNKLVRQLKKKLPLSEIKKLRAELKKIDNKIERTEKKLEIKIKELEREIKVPIKTELQRLRVKRNKFTRKLKKKLTPSEIKTIKAEIKKLDIKIKAEKRRIKIAKVKKFDELKLKTIDLIFNDFAQAGLTRAEMVARARRAPKPILKPVVKEKPKVKEVDLEAELARFEAEQAKFMAEEAALEQAGLIQKSEVTVTAMKQRTLNIARLKPAQRQRLIQRHKRIQKQLDTIKPKTKAQAKFKNKLIQRNKNIIILLSLPQYKLDALEIISIKQIPKAIQKSKGITKTKSKQMIKAKEMAIAIEKAKIKPKVKAKPVKVPKLEIPVIPKLKVKPKPKPKVKRIVIKEFTPVQMVNQIATLKTIFG